MKDTAKELCSFLEQKLSLIRSYISITEGLNEKIRNNEDIDIQAILSQRKNCMRQIERIDGFMEKIKKKSRAQILHFPNQDSSHIQTLPLQGGGEGSSEPTSTGREGAGGKKLSFRPARRGAGERLIDGYLQDIKAMLETAYGKDKELLAAVKEEGERIQSELLHVRTAKQAAQGYGRTKGAPPRFLDAVR